MIGTLVVKRLRFAFKAMQILILLNSDIDLLFLYELIDTILFSYVTVLLSKVLIIAS